MFGAVEFDFPVLHLQCSRFQVGQLLNVDHLVAALSIARISSLSFKLIALASRFWVL
jgi:hypothetical protein